MKNASRGQGRPRRWWSTSSIVLSGLALFVVLGGSAVAATGLIRAGDIAPGAVTGKAIRNGAVQPVDLSVSTRALLSGAPGVNGAKGDTGAPGSAGSNGVDGAKGINGVNGANGANGPNGANGANGIDGTDGIDGVDGTDGTDGADGVDGTITPLSAKQGLTALPTASPPTIVVELTVPAGSYVVLAKTQLSHTGAGDSIDCLLKANAATLDQVAMKTMPALAALPASLQAVSTFSASTQLSVQCDVSVANGAADFNSLIAIPTA